MKKKSMLLLIPLAVVGLAGCSPAKPPVPQCDSAVVTLDNAASVAVGATITLNASISIADCPITWSSNHPEIATVDENGKVTGVSAGTAIISANGAQCTVTVTGSEVVHVTKINITTPGTLYPNMIVGQKLQIVASVEPDNAPNKNLTYTTDNSAVAKVSESGEIEAVEKGEAKITVASVSDPDVKVDISVTVNKETIAAPTETSDGLKLVESGTLEDGDQIRIASIVEDSCLTMPVYTSGDYISPVEGSVNEDGKFVMSTSTALLTVKANEDNSLSLVDTNGLYLHAKSSNKLDFVSEDKFEDGCKFAITIADNVASIVSIKEGLDSNTLAYNSKNPRFSFYKPDTAATYPKIYVYKLEKAGPVLVESVEFDKQSYEVMVTKSVTVSAHTVPTFADNNGITYSLDGLSEEGCASIDASTGVLTGVKEGTGYVVATSVENAEKNARVPFTVSPLGTIAVEDEYLVTAESIATPSTYGDGGNDEIKFNQLTTAKVEETKIIQGNGSKSSVIWNDLPFSKPIKKVVITVNEGKKAGDKSTANLCFGASATCSEEIGLGTGQLDTAGSYEITPESSDSLYFKYVFTNGASYIESIKLVFKEEVIKELISISATNSKDTYLVGQSLDKSKVEVTAHYNTGDEILKADDYEIAPTSFQTAGDKIPVTISFGGQTTSFDVKVNNRSLVSLAIEGDMEKKEYYIGDDFDPKGLVVKGQYDNGDNEALEAGYTLEYSPAKAESAEVTQVSIVAKVGQISSPAHVVTGLSVTKRPVPVTGVVIDNGAEQSLYVGDTFQIQAHAEPEGADNPNLVYSVKSGSGDKIEVSTTGLVTAKAKGTAYVVVSSAEDSNKKAEVKFVISVPTVAVPDSTSAGFNKVKGDLVDGRQIQFVSAYEEKLYGLGEFVSGKNNHPAVEASIVDEKIVQGIGIGTYTVVKNADNSYSFQNKDGYLGATGGSGNNYLKPVQAVDGVIPDTAKFTVAVNSESGVASVKCIAEGTTRNSLAMNFNSPNPPIFACYDEASLSKYSPIYIFDKANVVESVTLTATTASVVKEKTLTINAEVLPENAEDKTLTWDSSNKAVATVSQEGVVAAISEGTTKITATSVNGVVGEYNVTVTDGLVHVTGVTFAEDSITLEEEDVSNPLAYTVAPGNASDPSVSFSSSNTSVATVDKSTGVVTAVAKGTATITVVSNDNADAKDTMTVNVTEHKYSEVTESFAAVFAVDENASSFALNSDINIGIIKNDGTQPVMKLNGLRMYQGNNLVISSSVKNIKEIEFTTAKSDMVMTADVGEFSENLWKGNSKEVTFSFAKVDGGDSNLPFITIRVKYVQGSDAPTNVLRGLEIESMPSNLEYKEGEFFDPTGIKVNAVYGCGGAKNDVTNKVTFSHGQETALTIDDDKVTVSYTEAGITKSADIAITVVGDVEKFDYSFESKAITSTDYTLLNGVPWKFTGTSGSYNFETARGEQFGTKNAPELAMSLSSLAFKNVTVQKVVINTCGGSGINCTMGIKVGETDLACEDNNTVALTTTSTEYTFSGNVKGGRLSINFSQTSSAGIYIKSVCVYYNDVDGAGLYIPEATGLVATCDADGEVKAGGEVVLTATSEPESSIVEATWEITEGKTLGEIKGNILKCKDGGTIKVVAKSGLLTSNELTIKVAAKVASIATYDFTSLVEGKTSYPVTEDNVKDFIDALKSCVTDGESIITSVTDYSNFYTGESKDATTGLKFGTGKADGKATFNLSTKIKKMVINVAGWTTSDTLSVNGGEAVVISGAAKAFTELTYEFGEEGTNAISLLFHLRGLVKSIALY